MHRFVRNGMESFGSIRRYRMIKRIKQAEPLSRPLLPDRSIAVGGFDAWQSGPCVADPGCHFSGEGCVLKVWIRQNQSKSADDHVCVFWLATCSKVVLARSRRLCVYRAVPR